MASLNSHYRQTHLEWLERKVLLSIAAGTCSPLIPSTMDTAPTVESESSLESDFDNDKLMVQTISDVLYNPGISLNSTEETETLPERWYRLAGWTWPKPRIPVGYYINTSNLPSGVNETDFISAIDNSFQSWEDIPTTAMSFFRVGFGSQYATGAADGMTTVGFGTATSGALAHATTYSDGQGVTEFDVVLGDDRASWSANPGGPGGGKVDVWATATHEIGHGLGLGHSEDTNASMYYAIYIGSTHQRDPNSDDITGLEQLYPASTNQPPTAPGSITASEVSQNQATISWGRSTDSDGDSITYEVQFRQDNLSDNWSNSSQTSETSTTLSGLENNATYRVRVRASDGQTNSNWTEAFGLFTTLPTNQKPTAPGFATATKISDQMATLAWSVSNDPDGDSITYEIQYQNDDPSAAWSNSLISTTASSTIVGLNSNQTYHVRVRAFDGQLNSEWTKTSRLFTTRPTVLTYQIGEVGLITDLTHVSRIISLNSHYRNPVVFAQSSSVHGSDPVVVRVDNVQSDQFSIYLAEPSNLNGFHNAPEKVNYLVLEAGIHQLGDGTLLEVGRVDTAATIGKSNQLNEWENIRFHTNFKGSPVVLSQIQSKNGQKFLQTRQNAITTNEFLLALEQEEIREEPHVQETIGYLAMEAGSGTWNRNLFEAHKTSFVITDVWNSHSFYETFENPPHFLSSLTSYNGSDSAHLRYTNLDENGVQLKIEEDTTADTETSHTVESVAYLAIGGTGALTAVVPQVAIGEVGRINALTHTPQTIFLDQQYNHPVVFVQSPTNVGQDPIAVRVTDVQSNQFTTFLSEPSNENGFHNAPEIVTYLVIEAGKHELINGSILEVQTIDTTATVGRILANRWENILFDSGFESPPVVLSQVQTTTRQDFLHTRQNGITSEGFQLALEQEEAIGTQHVQETVGYLAMEAGTSVSGGLIFEAMQTSNSVTDAWSTFSFHRVFDAAPYFLSSLSSYHGRDNSHLRYEKLDQNGVDLKIGEDTTVDTETGHLAETVAYLAIGGAGTLTAVPAQEEIGEVGRINNLTHTPQTIFLEREYSNPIVFAQSPTQIGNDPIAVRVTDIRSNQFKILLTEPSNENGYHNAQETISYLVLETGMHQLPDGRQLEAQTVETTATVGQLLDNRWENVVFDSSFNSTPVVLTQIQTMHGLDYLQTRQQTIDKEGFAVALEQESAIAIPHAAETVGYLAIESGNGMSNNLVFEASYTPTTVSNNWTTHSFNQIFSTPPHFLSSLASYQGSDSAHIRYANLNATGVQLRIGEDTTNDEEIQHIPENVAYLAFSGAGMITATPSPQHVMVTIPTNITTANTMFSKQSPVVPLVISNSLSGQFPSLRPNMKSRNQIDQVMTDHGLAQRQTFTEKMNVQFLVGNDFDELLAIASVRTRLSHGSQDGQTSPVELPWNG